MAALAHAQHTVATMLAPAATLAHSVVTRAIEARLPSLAADGHRRDASWGDGLALLLELDVAAGLPLPLRQEQVELKGHAMEVRLYAEDPAHGFLSADLDPGAQRHLLQAACAAKEALTNVARLPTACWS